MKYFCNVVVPASVWPSTEGERRGPRRRSAGSRQFRRDVADDLREFHPFLRGMPRHRSELAEEIGARLTVLAVRTHVPLRGRPRPPVTLRMRHALRILSRSSGESTISRLAARLGVGVPAACQLVRRMERRQLVLRTVGRRDRRFVFVELTRTGWRHISTDEDMSAPRLRAVYPPLRTRRASQSESPLEAGLRAGALDLGQLLGGLRAVQATMYGFSYERWETDFAMAISARRRHRRDRSGERYAIAQLGAPRYAPPARRGRHRGSRARSRRLGD